MTLKRRARLILGCNTFGLLTSEAEARGLVERALCWGLTAFDTSPSYGRDGSGELSLGNALASAGHAAKVYTKVEAPESTIGSARHDHVRRSVERSLNRLGLTSLAGVAIEANGDAAWQGQAIDGVRDCVALGLVGHAGAYGPNAEALGEALSADGGHGFVQVRRNLLETGGPSEMLPQVARHAVEPLAGGLLTGKYFAKRSEAGRFDLGLATTTHERLAKAHHLWLAFAGLPGGVIGASLAWLRTHSDLDGIVIGARRSAQLADALRRLAAIEREAAAR